MVPKKVCSIEGCGKPHNSRGLCHPHYGKLSRLGQLPARPTVQERFWAKVDKTATCWEWTASVNPKGYAQFNINGRCRLAHRYSYTIHFGPIPDGLLVDHMCHNPACVNPAHLRAVTTKQNEENRVGANRTSATGVRGVSWDKKAGKWVAQITHNWKPYFAGYFDTIPEAEAAVIAKRNELFTHNDLDRVSA